MAIPISNTTRNAALEYAKALESAVRNAEVSPATVALLEGLQNLTPEQMAQVSAFIEKAGAQGNPALRASFANPLKAVNPENLSAQQAQASTSQVQQRAIGTDANGRDIVVTTPALGNRNTDGEVDVMLSAMAKAFERLDMPAQAEECRRLAEMGSEGSLERLKEISAKLDDALRATNAAKATGSATNAATSTATTSGTLSGGVSFQDQVESGSIFNVVPPEETITGKETDVELARKQQKMQKHALIMQMITQMVALDHETKKGIVQNWRA